MTYVPAVCTAGVALLLTMAAAAGGSCVRRALADGSTSPRVERAAPERTVDAGERRVERVHRKPSSAGSTIPVHVEHGTSAAAEPLDAATGVSVPLSIVAPDDPVPLPEPSR